MKALHYRITVDYGPGASPRHFDYATHEGMQAFIAACEEIGRTLDDSLSPVSVTITNVAKIAERETLDRAAAETCPDCGTPEAIVDAINADLLRRL